MIPDIMKGLDPLLTSFADIKSPKLFLVISIYKKLLFY